MTLSQTVATTAGEHYTVDFWVMQDQPPIGGDDFSASWNGTTLTSLVDVGQQSGYTEYQFDVTGAAGSDSSTLKFSANNEGYWDIDDVSVLKGAPNTVQQMSDATTAVSGVNATDTLVVSPNGQNSLGTVTATAGNGSVEWQFQATNAQLDHLMGLTQSYSVADQNNANVSQTVSVSVGGNGNDQFVFHQGVGADAMVNFLDADDDPGPIRRRHHRYQRFHQHHEHRRRAVPSQRRQPWQRRRHARQPRQHHLPGP